LEENAYFCHKCGAPAVTLIPAPEPPSARPAQKKRVSPEVIALVAVVAVAVILVVIVFALLFSANFNQANNNANQGNTMSLSFNPQGGTTNASVLNQNLIQGVAVPFLAYKFSFCPFTFLPKKTFY